MSRGGVDCGGDAVRPGPPARCGLAWTAAVTLFVPVRRPGAAWPVAVLQLPSAAQTAAVTRGSSPLGLSLWVPVAARHPARAQRTRTGRERLGTEGADLRALLDAGVPPAERLAALERTVE